MKIKAQDGEIFEAAEIIIKHFDIYCRDKKNRQKKHWLGTYRTPSLAANVYTDMELCRDNLFEMPKR